MSSWYPGGRVKFWEGGSVVSQENKENKIKVKRKKIKEGVINDKFEIIN